MTEMVLERSILPEPLFSQLGTEKVLMRADRGVITLAPVETEERDSDMIRRYEAFDRLNGCLKDCTITLEDARAERLSRQ